MYDEMGRFWSKRSLEFSWKLRVTKRVGWRGELGDVEPLLATPVDTRPGGDSYKACRFF